MEKKAIKMFKKYLSYLFPVKHKIYRSKISEQLEITWINGALVVDTKHANYSYGSLQKILRKGLKKIGFTTVKQLEQVLVLGVGGGSVIKTLNDEILITGNITGVEIDPVMIGIAYEYYHLDHYKNVRILQHDAEQFMYNNKTFFNLIIVDLFQDIHIPDFVYHPKFIKALQNSLAPNGYLLFNTIVLNKKIAELNNAFCNYFTPALFSLQRYPEFDDKNEVIIIQKKAS